MEQSVKSKGKVFICGAGPGDPETFNREGH